MKFETLEGKEDYSNFFLTEFYHRHNFTITFPGTF
jgi:hypothetical protein